VFFYEAVWPFILGPIDLAVGICLWMWPVPTLKNYYGYKMRFPELSLLEAVEVLNKVYNIAAIYGIVLVVLSAITMILDPVLTGWVVMLIGPGLYKYWNIAKLAVSVV